MSPINPPFLSHSRIKLVQSFQELVTTPFGDGVNALCWPRLLAGDFAEVAARVASDEDIATLDPDGLKTLPLSDAGRMAVKTMTEDHQRLSALGLSPVLNRIRAYPRDDEGGPVPTDVYSFHADSATVETDTYLCTYLGAWSEGLVNEEAERCVDRPATRAALLQLYGGEDDAGFLEFLHEHCYDLHYHARPGATPYPFGLGNLWRIAVEYPGSPVPPCVHRAPDPLPSESPRLLLIS